MRDDIATVKAEAVATLNELLHEEFKRLKIQFEQATWDDKKNAEGKPQKRPVKVADIEALRPFHWGYEFDEIINRRGGFDVILTNPPWEIFKPQAKEFFAEHTDLVTKNKMTIKEFEKEQAKLLKKPEIRLAWLEYRSRFPHVNLFFRNAPQYRNQESIVNGRKQTTDLNLYKLFLEQCFNLLRTSGECGIVIPSGIYTDLGAKQLREMLFDRTKITGLFGFENRKFIFEGVDIRFKFVVLTFCKGEMTISFPSAFMRHEVAELETFP
ncbi:MAG: Eco57I restriction-modification methylase domain-containing protein [Blastocatellales bacterium]|nr:Eco57I restriction-modification methylase domain-containing protein [Blastocatellales bacterium]